MLRRFSILGLALVCIGSVRGGVMSNGNWQESALWAEYLALNKARQLASAARRKMPNGRALRTTATDGLVED